MAGESGDARSWEAGKAPLFAGIVGGVLVVDFVTKLLVLRSFRPYQQVDVIGEYLRFTFIQNPGAAFGIHLGDHSRIIFLVLSLIALAALAALYWATPARDRARLVAIALICGGALGNLVDRIRFTGGVVDFLDVGIGDLRWPIFNVADIAVTTGAILLALSLWSEDRRDERSRPAG